jgi:hypothetical protein
MAVSASHRALCAFAIVIVCLFLALTGRAQAALVPLDDGTWSDTYFGGNFYPGVPTPPATTGTLGGMPDVVFPIDPTSTAVYDTTTGKYSGILKLEGGFIFGISPGPLTTNTNIYLDFSTDAGAMFPIDLGLDDNGTPAALLTGYGSTAQTQIVGNQLTATGEIGGYNMFGPYQLNVTLPATGVPLPAAAWTGLIGLCCAAIVGRRLRTRARA